MPIIGDSPKVDVGAMKFKLRAALVESRHWEGPMTEREGYDTVGLKLQDEFVSYLEVLSAFCRLPFAQRACVYLNLAEGLAQETIAEKLGVESRTVNRYIVDGYRAMVEMIWS